MNYYTFHSGDYLRDTSHLSLVEDAIYRRCLDWYYTNESPLPNDFKKIARLIRASDFLEYVQIVVTEFFVLSENGWSQNRCDDEIAIYHGKAQKARENGQKGGRPKTKTKPNHNLEITQSVILDNPEITESQANQEPRTKNHINTNVDFDLFWQLYPNKAAKQNALKAWVKLKPNEALIDKIMQALKKQIPNFSVGFIPHGATWLNGKRWEDEVQPTSNQQQQPVINHPKQQNDDYIHPPLYVPKPKVENAATPEQVKKIIEEMRLKMMGGE